MAGIGTAVIAKNKKDKEKKKLKNKQQKKKELKSLQHIVIQSVVKMKKIAKAFIILKETMKHLLVQRNQ